ncbi:tetraspanin-1 [Kryptolebias marmoratus]|uniref:tetraspanin-1 n=1 Tax=Kryptolebias marmoratus TaxID=37003 RepID=UPI0007F8DE1B|nr:tetraspanin-1 [Kryptolebias marmoratus]XP_024866265.1 tetraspanin-1 [Kryptolebias marmoratus]XP_024866267.1 tetraspanin-1 [Kryptolebias marmoratus]XP_037837201.1 tetraspanin-1 [Kryptolebias marmoratus]
MSCCPFVRLMMVLFNLLVFIAGLVLLAVGIWVSVDGSPFLQLLGPFSRRDQPFVNVGFFCISAGAILVLVGLLGSCGARKESKCLLISFFSIILIIFVAEVAAGVVALFYSSFAERILEPWATRALRNDYGRDPEVTQLWNSTMTEFGCCGFSGYSDFLGSEFLDQNRGELPPSCCWTNAAPCRPEDAARSPVQGCFRLVLTLLRQQSVTVGGVATGVTALQAAGLMVSVYLYTHLDRRTA